MMNYTKKKRVVKHKRYIAIIKACKLIRIRDKSFWGFNSLKYAVTSKLTKFDKLLCRRKSYSDIFKAITNKRK